MATTERSVRAWVPATVTTLLGLVLVVGGGLAWEALQDQDVDAINNPDSAVGMWVFSGMRPLGTPGIIGDAPFEDSVVPLLGGLVPFVVLLFVFTWLGARGSALTAFLGAWLGSVLAGGLGALTAFEVFLRRDDLIDANGLLGAHAARTDRLGAGLYWGVAVGLLLALVALAVRAMSRRSRGLVDPDEPASTWPPPADGDQPADTSAFAPPSGPAEETAAAAPETTAEPRPDTPSERRAP